MTESPYVATSETSHEAARRVSHNRVARVRNEVARLILYAGPQGLTDEEIIDAIDPTRGSTIRPRRVDLVRSGAIVDSGERRLTRSRFRAAVWIWYGYAPPPHESGAA